MTCHGNCHFSDKLSNLVGAGADGICNINDEILAFIAVLLSDLLGHNTDKGVDAGDVVHGLLVVLGEGDGSNTIVIDHNILDVRSDELTGGLVNAAADRCDNVFDLNCGTVMEGHAITHPQLQGQLIIGQLEVTDIGTNVAFSISGQRCLIDHTCKSICPKTGGLCGVQVARLEVKYKVYVAAVSVFFSNIATDTRLGGTRLAACSEGERQHECQE